MTGDSKCVPISLRPWLRVDLVPECVPLTMHPWPRQAPLQPLHFLHEYAALRRIPRLGLGTHVRRIGHQDHRLLHLMNNVACFGQTSPFGSVYA
jgi:hypothetical protein